MFLYCYRRRISSQTRQLLSTPVGNNEDITYYASHFGYTRDIYTKTHEGSKICWWERKHGALRPQKPLRLIRHGKLGGREILYLTLTRYTVTTRMTLL